MPEMSEMLEMPEEAGMMWKNGWKGLKGNII
jgi:hypothetical protein